MVDIRDYTPRIYEGFSDLINNGSEDQIGAMLDGNTVYDPISGRLESQNVGDTYLLRVNITGKTASRGNKCNCGIYMFTGNANDSIKIAEFDFRFRQRRFETVSIATGFYTLNTFVANYAKIKCDFKVRTWVNEVDYWFTRINRSGASPSTGLTAKIAKVSPSADILLLGTGVEATPISLSLPNVDRMDSGWAASALNNSLIFTGSPDYVDLKFNAKVFISNTANFQRPNYVAQVVRVNDGKVMAQAASTYIRDSNDHEEASWNISVIDESPPANPEYRVRYYRETSNATQIISIESEGAGFSAIAY